MCSRKHLSRIRRRVLTSLGEKRRTILLRDMLQARLARYEACVQVPIGQGYLKVMLSWDAMSMTSPETKLWFMMGRFVAGEIEELGLLCTVRVLCVGFGK